MPTDFRTFGEPAHCVGRADELAQLQGFFHDAALGEGSVTILAGASGSGKSRLLRECAKIRSPVVTMCAQCSAVPMPGQELRAQIRELPSLIAHKPVAVLVDDAHLAASDDRQTLDALASMARRQRLALIATLLDESVEPARRASVQMGGLLVQSARYRAIEPLDEKAIELLVRGLLKTHDTTLPGNLLREIVATAQGNPRFAIELAECAVRSPSPGMLVPPSAQMIAQRVRGALSPTTFDTLLLCSALGDRFDDGLVAKISQRSLTAVAEALQDACDLGVLAEESQSTGWFSFRHVAVRKAIYLSMISPKRRLLHRRIVKRLKALNGKVVDRVFLADQWDALQDHPRAAAALTEAASHLETNRSFAGAADAYERAAAHLDVGTAEWFEVGRALADCYERIGNYTRIIPLVESIRSVEGFCAHQSADQLLEKLFFAYLNEYDWNSGRRVIEQISALECSDAPDVARRARLVLAYAYGASGHQIEAARLMGDVDPAALLDDESRWRHCMAGLVLDAAREPLDALLARVDRGAEIGRNVSVPAETYTYTEGVALALQHGDLAAADAYRTRAAESAEKSKRGIARMRHEVVKNSALLCLLAGRLTEARELLLANLAWRGSGRYNEAFHAGIAVFVGMRTGDLPLVDAFFDPALLSAAVSRRDAELCGLLLPGFAEVMHVRGMAHALQSALHTCVEQRLIDPYLSIQLCAARYISNGSLGLVDAQIDAYRRDTVAPIAFAHAALAKAILARRHGKLAAAQMSAREAAKGYGQFRWRLYEAAALELASEPRGAQSIYAECGATTDVARVAAGQRRKVKRAPFGARLTAREREVARLVARKRSDREIARVLEISVRTVHHHVEAILSKLGVRGRQQLTQRFL